MVFLTSERFIKEASGVSDNINGKFLQASMREAQENSLKRILGKALLDKLKSGIQNGEYVGAPQYKELLDECQHFLTYTTLVEVALKCSYKIANAGVVKTSDENVQNASFAEIVDLKDDYQHKADKAAYDLQTFILRNRKSYPELTQDCCERIKSHLHTSASSGMFLGGARGKRIR